MTEKFGIYRIVCIPMGKAYYGSTRNWTVRKAVHRYRLRRGTHSSRYLQNSWRKYGEDAFRFEWVCDVPEDQLLDVEQQYLDSGVAELNAAHNAERPMKGLKHSAEWCREHAIPSTIRETLLTAPYGSEDLLDAVEAALDSGNGMLAVCEARLQRERVQQAAEAAELERRFPKRERDELFAPRDARLPDQPNQSCGKSNEWFQRQACRRWPGHRASDVDRESGEEE